MSEVIFSADNVSKVYKLTIAVNEATFEIEKGKIYGFIGQNGAGKTTLIRMVTGLTNPTKGSMCLFGATKKKDLAKARKKIGCIIESPSFYPNMTAYENLKIQQVMYGISDDNQIKELLETVGLTDTGKKKVRNFSLGMRQRLAIALALVNNPEFLILDEPTNGLDPVGIKEVRLLLKKVNEEKGITILVSSHILSEIYQLATDYIIIHKGSIIQQLTHEELDKRTHGNIRIKVDDTERAVALLRERLQIENIDITDDIIEISSAVEVEKVARLFMDERVLVTGLTSSSDDLESYYLKLIGGDR
ncbi:MAG: ABC transporter ATP-binding protein [Lachnospiraceae bacterium]|nr:ABC transporter ATP-binding protein [Lachnospiraceae bacterium]